MQVVGFGFIELYLFGLLDVFEAAVADELPPAVGTGAYGDTLVINPAEDRFAVRTFHGGWSLKLTSGFPRERRLIRARPAVPLP